MTAYAKNNNNKTINYCDDKISDDDPDHGEDTVPLKTDSA